MSYANMNLQVFWIKIFQNICHQNINYLKYAYVYHKAACVMGQQKKYV